MLWTPAVTSPMPEHSSQRPYESPEATVSRLGFEEQNSAALVQLDSSTRKGYKKRGPKQFKHSYPQGQDALGPLFLRQSDNQLVHLHCCVIGCNKAYFKNVTALMRHIASPAHHGFGKGFLKNHADAIEKCGRVPDSDEEFVQVPPRDTVNKRSSGLKGSISRNTLSSDNAPRDAILTSSLVRMNGKGPFGNNIDESINGFPPSDRFRSDIGMDFSRLEDEAEPVYVLTNGNINHDIVSNGLSSAGSTPIPDTPAAGTATETRIPDIGTAVKVKEEEQNTAEEPAAMWIDTIPSSAMSMPAEHIEELIRHDRAITTHPERNILTSPRVRKRHASTGPDDNHEFFKEFC